MLCNQVKSGNFFLSHTIIKNKISNSGNFVQFMSVVKSFCSYKYLHIRKNAV